MKQTNDRIFSPEILRQKAEELLKKNLKIEILELIQELAFQNEEKAKRTDELIIANKELAFQNEEKEKRADELIIANKELAFQNEEKEKRADELIIANKELAFHNEENAKREIKLIIENNYELLQNEEIRIQQTELKTQNEKLLLATTNTIDAAEKYIDLFESAPVGYIVLSILGEIIEINQTGIKILGKEKLHLKGARFGFFVSEDTKPDFNRFLENVFNCQAESSTCEVILSVFNK